MGQRQERARDETGEVLLRFYTKRRKKDKGVSPGKLEFSNRKETPPHDQRCVA